MNNDYYYMKRALSLARKGAGKTSPNPLVGAVIVSGEEIIGEGFHRKYGHPHAEVEAIRNASTPVKGSTLYCTLEPCSYTSTDKNNPPCTERIISEGIKRVVIASTDPNPRVNGNGVKTLKKAGIEVVTGIMEEESRELNAAYNKWMSTGKPYVHLKIAQSLDGRIATGSGNSKWITDDAARTEVHRMRSLHDGVVVGSGTVLADDPSLLVRNAEGRQPVRIVLDGRFRIGKNFQVVKDLQKTIIFTGKKANRSTLLYLKSDNVEILQVEETGRGLDLEQVLVELGKRKFTSILVEGGGAVFTSFIKSKLWDKISVFIAPVLIGKGIEAVGDLGILSLSDAVRFDDISFKQIGNQVLFEGKKSYTENTESLNVYRIN